jgi:hypothetical protein
MSTRSTTMATPPAFDLVPLRDMAWRVCDRNCDDGDTRKILGYLQLVDGEFEMMWMRPRPGVCRRYATFEAATAAIATRMRTLP